MGPLTAMLSALVVTDVGATVTRYKRNGILWAVAGLFFTTAYVFALVLAGLYLATLYGPIVAAAILAGASLAIGLVIVVVMLMLNARDRRIAEERRRRSQAQAGLAIATALTLFRKKPLLSAGLAIGVGTVLGLMRKPGSSDES